MSEEKKRGFLMIEEAPNSAVAQAITAFFSPFMISASGAMLSDAMKKAPCVLVENVPINVGKVLVEKVRSLGAQVAFRTANGKSRPLCRKKR